MSDLYYYGQQAMLKQGTKATPIPKVAADEIERLEADCAAKDLVIERVTAERDYWRSTFGTFCTNEEA
jgi:hypothetical protein